MNEFKFKPFNEMTAADYAEVGFMSGLEIHQQLRTEKKLFCRCPAGRYSHAYDAEILRHMRPTLSELGEYDGTALMEFKTKKEIIYQINRDTVCTYEMDDTPPFFIDEEALDIALSIAILYNCNMVDELHIARKQYLDGSIPTGFQRTTIVGVNGHIPYKDREIRIVQLGLEEDACREVSDVGHRRTYLTDRLGMPLIETVTAPDMKTPDEVAEVAQLCRRIVRSTGRVRTGLGAARMDTNVSVRGGTRVEIKGVPRIPRLPLLTYHEAMRQWNLLRLRDELGRRGLKPETFKAEFGEVTGLLKETGYAPIRDALARGFVANAVVLRNFGGLLDWQTQTKTRFAQEVSDRVRVVACLTTLPNIVNSDTTVEALTASEWEKVCGALQATKDDTVVVVWGDEADAKTGAQEIIIRAKEATIGVPSETRQALRDGTNGFERILPGPDRMYPDTDLPPKRVTRERLAALKLKLPKAVWEREAAYKELKVPEDLIKPLAMSRFAPLFERAIKDWKAEPVATAVALIQYPKRLRRKGLDAGRLDGTPLENVLRAYGEGKLLREAIWPALEFVAQKGVFDAAKWPPRAAVGEVTRAIKDAVKKLSGLKVHNPDKKSHVVMGLVMSRLRGRAAGAAVAEKVKEALREKA